MCPRPIRASATRCWCCGGSAQPAPGGCPARASMRRTRTSTSWLRGGPASVLFVIDENVPTRSLKVLSHVAKEDEQMVIPGTTVRVVSTEEIPPADPAQDPNASPLPVGQSQAAQHQDEHAKRE